VRVEAPLLKPIRVDGLPPVVVGLFGVAWIRALVQVFL